MCNDREERHAHRSSGHLGLVDLLKVSMLVIGPHDSSTRFRKDLSGRLNIYTVPLANPATKTLPALYIALTCAPHGTPY